MNGDQIIDIERQIEQMKARRQLMAARQVKRSRAEDTRRKILAGAVVLQEAQANPGFRNWLVHKLDRKLVRPNDRKLFDLSTS